MSDKQINKVRIKKLPPAGYVVLGKRTYNSVGEIVVTSQIDPDEIMNAVEDGYVEVVPDQS